MANCEIILWAKRSNSYVKLGSINRVESIFLDETVFVFLLISFFYSSFDSFATRVRDNKINTESEQLQNTSLFSQINSNQLSKLHVVDIVFG